MNERSRSRRPASAHPQGHGVRRNLRSFVASRPASTSRRLRHFFQTGHFIFSYWLPWRAAVRYARAEIKEREMGGATLPSFDRNRAVNLKTNDP
jgi:hypothetical protein